MLLSKELLNKTSANILMLNIYVYIYMYSFKLYIPYVTIQVRRRETFVWELQE